MAFSADKNRVFHERLQNLARATQNLREEAARLAEWYQREIAPGGTPDKAYTDTPIATTAECDALIGGVATFEDYGDAVASGALVPFLADARAG